MEDEKFPERFTTTRWSLIRSCGQSEDARTAAQEALEQLCRIYWRPIFAFICRRGYSVADAEDLTQDFFFAVLKGHLIQRADPLRGRFRSILLKGLQDFLNDATRKRHSLKRGGGVDFVSWDEWVAEAPSQLSVPLEALEHWPPERLFDLRWAATVTEQALRRLAEECAKRGRRRVFDVLSAYLTTDRGDISYDAVGATLGLPSETIKRLVRQLRLRYRALLRDEVAQTVDKLSDVDDEIRYLCATLATAESRLP